MLGLFFISVGASIDFAIVAGQPLLVMGLVGALIGGYLFNLLSIDLGLG